ncbi:uncharacterized protein BJX67DRAFT_166526 [Aspergillus lucknowensis]|uniref:Uncharacterized protein n=1 Tax=Aspergillus lucknowensis TaxID=176173 RepID=A0ABR4M4Q5_9EURO
MANTLAIEASMQDIREQVITHIINCVESQFRIGFSTEADARRKQLRKFLQRCSDLKVTLSRQQAQFYFFCTPFGEEFSAQALTHGGGEALPAGNVRLSLWPGILRRVHGTDGEVLGPELVWKMASEF